MTGLVSDILFYPWSTGEEVKGECKHHFLEVMSHSCPKTNKTLTAWLLELPYFDSVECRSNPLRVKGIVKNGHIFTT